MPSIRQSTLLSFCLLMTVWVGSGCGSQAASVAQSSETPPPVTKSSTKSTETSSELGLTSLPEINPTKQAEPATAKPVKVTLNKVKIFFPKSPKSQQDFTYVEPVWRTTTSQSLAQFAIAQLLAGPTNKEKTLGLVNPIKLKGSSNCGSDFTLSVSQGVAKLRFCKTVVSAGIGDDARAKSSINATLKQFSTIKSVIVLDKNGNCLADQSGENFCLKKAQHPFHRFLSLS